MTNEPIEELYFQWLYGLVSNPAPTSLRNSYWNLLRFLHQKEFVWFVLNDDNRAEDGASLRLEFVQENPHIHASDNWLELGCSFLEMLIGLSRRLEFETDGAARAWFWHLLKTIHISEFSDLHELPVDTVNETVDRVIWRTYEPDGSGGLFPLANPRKDQRAVEIWYQLNSYLIERD